MAISKFYGGDYSILLPTFEMFNNSEEYRKAIEKECKEFFIVEIGRKTKNLCKLLAKRKRSEHPIHAELRDLSDATIKSLIEILKPNLRKNSQNGIDPKRLSIAEHLFDNFPHFPASELSQTLHKIRIEIYQFESFGKLYKNPKYLHIQTLENLYASDHYQLSLQRVTKMLSVADIKMIKHFAVRLNICICNDLSDYQVREQVIDSFKTKYGPSVYENVIWVYLSTLPKINCDTKTCEDLFS